MWPLCSVGDNTQFQILQIQFIAKQSGKYSPILNLILSTTDYSIAYKIPRYLTTAVALQLHGKFPICLIWSIDSIENLQMRLDEKFVYM